MDADISEKKTRTCLRCRNPFMSAHAGNRICPNCDKLNGREFIPRMVSSTVYTGEGVSNLTQDD